MPWAGRDEDKTDDGVWAVTCFVTRTGFRRRGVSRALVRAAVASRASAAPGPSRATRLILQPGKKAVWGELYVGSPSIFADAGFTEVAGRRSAGPSCGSTSSQSGGTMNPSILLTGGTGTLGRLVVASPR